MGISATLTLIISFIMSLLIAPLIIKGMRRLHAEQSILEYVDNHNAKAGTPTMGGLIFLIPTTITALIMGGVHSKIMLVTLGTMLSFGLLGFLDDFIKVKCKHNQGLKAYQKIIGQLGIAVIIVLFAYYSPYIGSIIRLPFSDKSVDFGYAYIPFTIVVFLATTNSVNLIDGLDGLASSTTMIYLVAFAAIIGINGKALEGDVIAYNEYRSETIFTISLIGGLMAFLMFNSSKASIFMGDTGSLALGGVVGAVAVFSRNTLLIPIIGIMYMITSISVIVQVLYFKVTGGKRIFKMAPLHHHLQYSGMSECKIVTIYSMITIIGAVIALVSIV